jgi:hypothetical protein
LYLRVNACLSLYTFHYLDSTCRRPTRNRYSINVRSTVITSVWLCRTLVSMIRVAVCLIPIPLFRLNKNSKHSNKTTPSHLKKKTKSFCSTNHYTILATKDDNVEPTVISTYTVIDSNQLILLERKINSNARAPPIYIKNTSIVNFSALKNTLIRLTSVNGFSCKSTF